jgi:hypothetical protein
MASKYTHNKFGLQDQCSVTFMTKKGANMLFLFMNIPNNPNRSPYDSSDHVYEIMNMETGEVFLLTGSKYDNLVRSGYFHSINKTNKYMHLTDVLAKKSSLSFILTCDSLI